MVIDITPVPVDLRVTRRSDVPLRYTIRIDGVRYDLTGSSFRFLAKDAPGGTVKLNQAMAIDGDADHVGDITVTLPLASLVGAGYPNDSPTADISWVYQIRWTTATGEVVVPFDGALVLAPTI